jgi:hypothetical protein
MTIPAMPVTKRNIQAFHGSIFPFKLSKMASTRGVIRTSPNAHERKR